MITLSITISTLLPTNKFIFNIYTTNLWSIIHSQKQQHIIHPVIQHPVCLIKILNNKTMTINRKPSTEWVRSNPTSMQRHTELDNLFNCIFRNQLFLNGVTACGSHGHKSKDFLQQIRPNKATKTRTPRCLVFIWR